MKASESIVTDPVVGRAVSSIVPNSDQQLGSEILESTFVDTGILGQLDSRNNQILFGRRGTGKSHLLRLLAARRNLAPGQAAVFVDVRRLGSAQLMTNMEKPISVRSVSVFRDLLAELQSHLLDLATDPRQPERIDALEGVSELADTIAAVSTRIAGRDVAREGGESASRTSGLSVAASTSPSLHAKASSSRSYSEKFSERYTEVFEDTIIFSEIAVSLEHVISTLCLTNLLLVLDEWVAIPPDIQPYVAEFLKRAIIPSQRISLKIASLAYGSNFAISGEGAVRVGFSFGGEITRNVDLDEHYGFERTPALAEDTFTNLLWRHLITNIPDPDYLASRYGISDEVSLREGLFDGTRSFAELLRAGSGVPRDFLSIFTAAYFRAAISRSEAIGAEAIQDAARTSFRTEKLLNLDAAQERTLMVITAALDSHNAGICFTLDRSLLSHSLVQSLYDLRVIHIIQPYYTVTSRRSGAPGASTLYSLDYGAALTLRQSGSSVSFVTAVPSQPGPANLVPDLSDSIPQE